MEALTSLAVALGPSFEPYAPAVFERTLQQLTAQQAALEAAKVRTKLCGRTGTGVSVYMLMVSRLGGPRNSSHGWLPTYMGVSFGRCRLRPCFLMLRVGKHGDTPRMHTPNIALRCTVKRTAASIRRPLCFAKKQHSRGAKSAALPLTCCRAVASVALRLLAKQGASPKMILLRLGLAFSKA
jgi:hypothetical protein